MLLGLQPYSANASNSADSLKKALHTYKKQDTTRIKILFSICDNYFYDDPDTLQAYATQALQIATQLNKLIAIGRSKAFIAESYYLRSKFDTALHIYNAALKGIKNIDAPELHAFIYNNIGSVYLRNNNYKKALQQYDTVVTIAQKANDTSMLATAFSNMASIYYKQGAYSSALKLYLQGMRLYEKLKQNSQVETALLNISNVYFQLDEFDKAKQTMARALAMAKKSGSKWSVISCHTTYAMIYTQQKHYDSAIAVLKEALQLSPELNNPYLTNLLKGNLAEAYLKNGELDKAFILYNESLPVSVQLEDFEGVAIAKAGIGETLAKKGQIDEGTTYMKEAIQMMQSYSMKEQAMALADVIASIYKRLGDYKAALEYTRIKELYQDSLAKDESRKAAVAIEYDYELNKKEGQIALLEKDKAIEVNKTKLNRILLISALAGMLLAVVIAVQFSRNLKNARNSNQLITQQKNEIEQQAKKLEQLNEFKDTTFSVLSHDLRSPINALTGTMAMLDEGIITPQEFAEHKDELNNKLQSVTLMLDNLLQWAKSQMKGEHTLDIERINVKRKVLRSFAILKDASQQKNITLSAEVPEELFVYADRNQLDMVMRNLLSNAVKFTPNSGAISVAAKQDGAFISIAITDTGMGMTEQQAKQLFDGSPNASTVGTSGEKGTGIGLHLSYGFIKNNGGEIDVTSSQGKGTTFTITLPAQPLA